MAWGHENKKTLRFYYWAESPAVSVKNVTHSAPFTSEWEVQVELSNKVWIPRHLRHTAGEVKKRNIIRCLHCSLTARRSWVRFPHGALLALGGRSSPECTVLKWAISRAFLCGVCMFSPCSQGVSSTKNPNSKNMQNNRTHVHP